MSSNTARAPQRAWSSRSDKASCIISKESYSLVSNTGALRLGSMRAQQISEHRRWSLWSRSCTAYSLDLEALLFEREALSKDEECIKMYVKKESMTLYSSWMPLRCTSYPQSKMFCNHPCWNIHHTCIPYREGIYRMWGQGNHTYDAPYGDSWYVPYLLNYLLI